MKRSNSVECIHRYVPTVRLTTRSVRRTSYSRRRKQLLTINYFHKTQSAEQHYVIIHSVNWLPHNARVIALSVTTAPLSNLVAQYEIDSVQDVLTGKTNIHKGQSTRVAHPRTPVHCLKSEEKSARRRMTPSQTSTEEHARREIDSRLFRVNAYSAVSDSDRRQSLLDELLQVLHFLFA